MERPTYATVDLTQFDDNYHSVRSHLKAGTKILASVKANAYGHGIVEIARRCQQAGVDYIGIAIPEEGELLRSKGVHIPILVLGPTLPEGLKAIVEYGIEQTITEKETLVLLQQEAQRQGKSAKVHLKFDTGMGRIGIRGLDTLKETLALIKDMPNIELAGFFTHFANSDAQDKTFALKQLAYFNEGVALVHEMGFSPIIHAANSGATLDIPEAEFDMVRVGILLYGYYPSLTIKKRLNIKPIMSLKSCVTQVKTMEAGESVGYDCTFTCKRRSVIATVCIGYGDGYRRSYSNRTDVLLHGRRVPVVGRVSMDQITVDVTELPQVKAGDEVVLIGKQGGMHVWADELCAIEDTICYETLLAISERVPRIYECE
ncbi:alanine racemase [Clostridia bacterium OttesenSCG-928-F22]|nr:alanine racemase [Clostridia bacterium OttesenSCG-928-F22]